MSKIIDSINLIISHLWYTYNRRYEFFLTIFVKGKDKWRKILRKSSVVTRSMRRYFFYVHMYISTYLYVFTYVHTERWGAYVTFRSFESSYRCSWRFRSSIGTLGWKLLKRWERGRKISRYCEPQKWRAPYSTRIYGGKLLCTLNQHAALLSLSLFASPSSSFPLSIPLR